MSPSVTAAQSPLVEPGDSQALSEAIVVDCRYALTDPDAGRLAYEAGHIPGAYYLDLGRDLSGLVRPHGGRHPMPAPEDFAATLASLGIHRGSEVIAYDDSHFAFAARLWWMMRSLGYRPPQLINGGYSAWLALGGVPDTTVPLAHPCESPDVGRWNVYCDINGVKQAQDRGALLVDSRDPRRYAGLEEPLDPVAGHIPGAINRPFNGVIDEGGRLKDAAGLREHWGDALEAEELVVYCGSGVTACVNLFALASLGRDDAVLYGGSWSDWSSYLQAGP